MTDLPTIIANVYRACGHEVEDPLIGEPLVFPIYPKSRPSSHFKALYSDAVGLDVFVRDIVPTLNERGWEPAFTQEVEPPPSDWDCQLYEIRSGANVGGARGKTPVEACFRAAWEALIPGENP